jgi:AcrR family transcriptional regulator
VQKDSEHPATPSPARRLSKVGRRLQLLETALLIVREENADRLTLAHLAVRAGVSKPVVYDHFPTRSCLLIELYTWIDTERINAFSEAMARATLGREEAVMALADAYIQCAADNTNEFFAVGAALAGSDEKAAVFQELLNKCVQMFVAVLTPHAALSAEELERRCTALVGAGEALSGAVVRGRYGKDDATNTFAALILGAVAT